MKKIALFVITALALTACKDQKAEEKAVLNDIIKTHDTVMGYDEQLMHNKMKLDTFYTTAKNTEAKERIHTLITQLTAADSAMSNWMQKFNPEQKGKSHDEIMSYFTEQKKQVKIVDSLVKHSVTESAEYLKPFGK